MNQVSTILVLVLASTNASRYLHPVHQFRQDTGIQDSYQDPVEAGTFDDGLTQLTSLGQLEGWNSVPDPRMYVLTELESPGGTRQGGDSALKFQDDSRVKRKGPSLSIVNPLDVLRQRLLIEMARRQKAESLGKIQEVKFSLKVTKKHEINIIMGDFNAKTVQGSVDGTVGQFGFGARNERGDRLLRFSEEEQLPVMNNFFELPPRRLYTWKSPKDGVQNIVHNQIDYVLINRRFRNGVQSLCQGPRSRSHSRPNPRPGTDPGWKTDSKNREYLSNLGKRSLENPLRERPRQHNSSNEEKPTTRQLHDWQHHFAYQT